MCVLTEKIVKHNSDQIKLIYVIFFTESGLTVLGMKGHLRIEDQKH